MKALSIRQPWAWLICAGFKDVENRTWPTTFRGRVYVHAGLSAESTANVPGWSRFELAYWKGQHSLGALVGEVDMVDCVARSDSPWFEGPYGFVLRNPTLYKEPIPYKGKLGFFEVNL